MTEQKRPTLKLKLGTKPKLDNVPQVIKSKAVKEYVPVKKTVPSKKHGGKKDARPPQFTRDTKTSRNKHFVGLDEYKQMLKKICRAKPKAFPPIGKPRKPLAVGIRHEVAKFFGITPQKSYYFLKVYCNTKAYKQALEKQGAKRVDINGKVVSVAKTDLPES